MRDRIIVLFVELILVLFEVFFKLRCFFILLLGIGLILVNIEIKFLLKRFLL